ncbi:MULTISPECIES: hypothetical protein [Burkholderia cepacia complex]|uniref:Uncharacterized protein n=1 Tax=Burkholderia pyrrocinia TaxID=60550 RepID=A0ABZ3BLQ7_BURPY|nr:hypothetical protein [Burkholderia stabilis]
MKNEIVTPAGANGEAGRRRRFAAAAVAVRVAGVVQRPVDATIRYTPFQSDRTSS